jgi:hypothetical protein
MEQWEVKRTTGQCVGTGRVLQPGEGYYAALIDRTTHFDRVDYCIEYWEQSKPEVYSFWKTRVPVPSQKKKLFVDDDVLRNFFERLQDETDTLKVNFRFVLALILMRKRLLKYEDSRRENNQEVWKMRFTRDDRTHEVVNPNLDEQQIAQVSQELTAILQGEL